MSILRVRQGFAGVVMGLEWPGKFNQSRMIASRAGHSRCALSRMVTACAALLFFGMCFDATESAAATTWRVTSTSDGDTTGTLRDAIQNASGGDTIFLAAGTGKTPITLTLGEIVLDKNLTITADKKKVATVSAKGNSRIFRVTSGANIGIENVVLADGDSTQYATQTLNVDGGGIYNSGVLRLTNVSMIRNRGYWGGAVYSEGSITVSSCVFADNNAVYGGGIGSNGNFSTQIQGSTFTRNSTVEACGAIWCNYGALTITSSSLTNNTVGTLAPNGQSAGGAIGVVNATATISGCTISGNTADVGGGLECYQCDVLVSSSKITGNTARANGSAIRDAFGNQLTIENSTLSGNVAANHGCLYLTGSKSCKIVGSKLDSNRSLYGGAIHASAHTLDIKQSAITNNTSTSGGGGIWCELVDFLVSDTDFTYNNCTQSDGGAIMAINCLNVVFTNARIRFNNALGYGGGLALVSCKGAISSSNITRNTSGLGGNDVYLYSSTIDFVNTVYKDLLQQP